MSARTTKLLSSGEFCKLRYDTIPVKSASAIFSFYTNDSKHQILSCDTLVANERYGAHSVFMCLVLISEHPASFTLHNITWWGFFTTEVVSVYYAVHTESLYIKQITFLAQKLKYHQNFWLCNGKVVFYCAVGTKFLNIN
jgi:hypothetical protein